MKNTQTKQLNAAVHVIDDDDAVLDSIGLLLTTIGINNHSYNNVQSFLDTYCHPDFDKYSGCILMDIRMPVMSGIECQYRLKELGCNLPLIFITGHGDVTTAVETMKNGAFDFIQKPYREQLLIDAIQKALSKNLSEQSRIRQTKQTKARLATLTSREIQILKAIVDGKANKVIAIELSLSQRTVEIHRAHVMEKMAVKSLPELVRIVLDTL